MKHKKIYFDTELLYRNNHNHLTSDIVHIRTSGINNHTIGFIEYDLLERSKLEWIYDSWTSSYLFLKELTEKYGLDFFEIKFYSVGTKEERLSIEINGNIFPITSSNFSNLNISILQSHELSALIESITELYNSMISFVEPFYSLIVGYNDGKHNNCLEFNN